MKNESEINAQNIPEYANVPYVKQRVDDFFRSPDSYTEPELCGILFLTMLAVEDGFTSEDKIAELQKGIMGENGQDDCQHALAYFQNFKDGALDFESILIYPDLEPRDKLLSILATYNQYAQAGQHKLLLDIPDDDGAANARLGFVPVASSAEAPVMTETNLNTSNLRNITKRHEITMKYSSGPEDIIHEEALDDEQESISQELLHQYIQDPDLEYESDNTLQKLQKEEAEEARRKEEDARYFDLTNWKTKHENQLKNLNVRYSTSQPNDKIKMEEQVALDFANANSKNLQIDPRKNNTIICQQPVCNSKTYNLSPQNQYPSQVNNALVYNRTNNDNLNSLNSIKSKNQLIINTSNTSSQINNAYKAYQTSQNLYGEAAENNHRLYLPQMNQYQQKNLNLARLIGAIRETAVDGKIPSGRTPEYYRCSLLLNAVLAVEPFETDQVPQVVKDFTGQDGKFSYKNALRYLMGLKGGRFHDKNGTCKWKSYIQKYSAHYSPDILVNSILKSYYNALSTHLSKNAEDKLAYLHHYMANYKPQTRQAVRGYSSRAVFSRVNPYPNMNPKLSFAPSNKNVVQRPKNPITPPCGYNAYNQNQASTLSYRYDIYPKNRTYRVSLKP